MEIKYNENLNQYTFKELKVGDTFVSKSGNVFVKIRLFSVCSRNNGICEPVDYNAYNLSLNCFSYFRDTETCITKVNCILEVN